MVDQVSDSNIWRINRPVILKGKWGSLIEPVEKLTHAVAGSNGNYLLTEKSVGTLPLGIIGSVPQIFLWLHQHGSKGVQNTIKELPHIYFGMTPYDPSKKPRFYGPVQMGGELIKQLTSFIPGGTSLTDFTGGLGDFYNTLGDILPKNKNRPEFGKGLHILTFHYLPAEGLMAVDSNGFIDFTHVARGIYKMWLGSR
jgi:hypothetical protein